MLQRLDKNFQNETAGDDLRWIDAFDDSIAIRGLAWIEENRAMRSFRRLPERSKTEEVFSEGVRHLSHCPSGAFLSFSTDSADISLRLELSDLELMDHMPATGQCGAELYLQLGHTWHAVATARPDLNEKTFSRSLIKNGPKEWRKYRLYLPLYKRVANVELGIQHGTQIKAEPAAIGTRPIVFYGTSITQGGCANTAGSDFVSQIGRMLDAETINLGFSGNGKGEPSMAELISEIEAEMFVLDYAANVEPDQLRSTLPSFVSILRQAQPGVSIVLIGNVISNQALWDRCRKDLLGKKRDTMMELYLAAKRADDPNIHFIDGNSLLVAGQSGVYVDGVHPTSSGFSSMADGLAPQLALIRLWSKSANSPFVL